MRDNVRLLERLWPSRMPFPPRSNENDRLPPMFSNHMELVTASRIACQILPQRDNPAPSSERGLSRSAQLPKINDKCVLRWNLVALGRDLIGVDEQGFNVGEIFEISVGYAGQNLPDFIRRRAVST